MMETLVSVKQETPTSSKTPSPAPSLKASKPAQNSNVTHKFKNVVSATECANCGTTTTPLWRRGPNGETICNACGLYLKARNTLRPPSLKRTVNRKQANNNSSSSSTNSNKPPAAAGTDITNSSTNDCGSGTCPGDGQCNGTGGSSSCAGCPAFNQHQVNRQALICANCRTTTTPLWRRDEQGNTICNACGLYYKLHNVHRPVSMKRSVIKRRKRIIVTQTSDDDDNEDDATNDNISSAAKESVPMDVDQQEETTITNTHPQPHSQPSTQPSQSIIRPSPIKRNRHQMMNNSSARDMMPEIEDFVTTTNNSRTTNIREPSPFAGQIVSAAASSASSTSPSPLYSKPYPESAQQQQVQNNSFLPPISSERQYYRLESLFNSNGSNSNSTQHRRDSSTSISSNHTATNNNNNNLPPISLPPLTPPSSQPQNNMSTSSSTTSLPPLTSFSSSSSIPSYAQIHQVQPPPTHNTTTVYEEKRYDLVDFDHALDKLEHLRRQVRPEQAYALSQLTQSLADLAAKAEAILSLDSLAYGR